MQPAAAHQLPCGNMGDPQCKPFLVCSQALNLQSLKCKEKGHLWLRSFCSYEELREDLSEWFSQTLEELCCTKACRASAVKLRISPYIDYECVLLKTNDVLFLF